MPGEATEFFRLTHDLTMGEWTKAEDTYIDQANPATVYSTNATLSLQDAAGAAAKHRMLVRFIVPPHSVLGDATVTTIILHLYNKGTGSGVNNLPNAWTMARNWIPAGINWNTYDSVNNWDTAGGLGTNDKGFVCVLGNVSSGGVAGWENWNLETLITASGIGVGDQVTLIFYLVDEAANDGDDTNYHSMESTTDATSWPSGAPSTWTTAGPDDFRPVIQIAYLDAKPTAVANFKVAPAADPSAVKFSWEPSDDAGFAAYGLYFSAVSGQADYTSGALVYQRGRGQAKILAAGVVDAESLQGSAGNPAENDLYYFSVAVEDASNTNASASYSAEIQVIRPDVLGAGRRNGGATASPETRKVSALGATTFSCGDKMCLAATGKGEDLTENYLVYRPTSIIVDWGDGTPLSTYPMKYTTFSGAEAADQLILSVTDSTIFVVGKCYVAYNGTNFDVFRVTAITGTTITVETDLAEAGRVADSIYFGYSGGDPIYGPLPEHIYTASGAFVPRAKLVNAAGFASDWTSATSLTIATLAPVAVIDASIRSPLTTDTVRYTANRSYNRDGGRPITSYRWSIDHAGTGGDPDADTTTTTVPYTTHSHGGAGTCRVALRVYDGTTFSATGNDYGDSNNPQGDVSLTVAAESVLALPGGLTDGFNQAFTYNNSSKIGKVNGIDVRERVIMGDGKALLYVQLSGTAYSSPTSNVPADVTTLHDAWTNKKGVTLSMPRSTSGVATLSGYIEDFRNHRTGVNSFDWTMDCVFDAPA